MVHMSDVIPGMSTIQETACGFDLRILAACVVWSATSIINARYSHPGLSVNASNNTTLMGGPKILLFDGKMDLTFKPWFPQFRQVSCYNEWDEVERKGGEVYQCSDWPCS